MEIANKKSILEMARGGIVEVVDREVDRVICNIMDPSTKATLAPVTPIKTALCITKGRGGELLMAEMTPQVPGQIDMDGGESPEPAIAKVGRMTY